MPTEPLCGPNGGFGHALAMWLAMTGLMMGPAAIPLALQPGAWAAARLAPVAAYAVACCVAAVAAAWLWKFATAPSWLAAALLTLAGAFQFSAAKRGVIAGCQRLAAGPTEATAADGARYAGLCLAGCGPAMLALAACSAMGWAPSLAAGGWILAETALGVPAAKLGGVVLFGAAGARLALG